MIKTVITIGVLGAAAIGGYFIYKHFKNSEITKLPDGGLAAVELKPKLGILQGGLKNNTNPTNPIAPANTFSMSTILANKAQEDKKRATITSTESVLFRPLSGTTQSMNFCGCGLMFEGAAY